jgi:hypothetical protein
MLAFVAGLSALGVLSTGLRLRRWLLALPAIALALDLLENALIVGLLLLYPAPAPTLAGALGLVSGLKFVAYGLVAATTAILLVTRALRRRSRHEPLPAQ